MRVPIPHAVSSRDEWDIRATRELLLHIFRLSSCIRPVEAV